jgi:hypothetical protein
MAISFDRAPLGITLSHVTPTGATHSSAFHTIGACDVNNKRLTNNVTVKVEIYNSLSDYNANKPMIDKIHFTFTLLKNQVSGKGKLQTVTRRDDILVQAYNHLMTLNAPDGSVTNYSGVTHATGSVDDNETRKGKDNTEV